MPASGTARAISVSGTARGRPKPGNPVSGTARPARRRVGAGLLRHPPYTSPSSAPPPLGNSRDIHG